MAKSHVSFKDYERQIKVPFVIYAHFDSIQIKKSKTQIIHQPCGFAYSVKCSFDDTFTKYEEYIGEDSPRVFWKKLQAEVEDISEKLSRKIARRVFNDEEKRLFGMISHCHFCGKVLGEDKFEDFYPPTGEFVGAVHEKCLQKPKIPNFVPVIMYKLGKYGGHFLLNALSEAEMKEVFEVGNNQGFQRKLRTMMVKFVDVMQFVGKKIYWRDMEAFIDDANKRRLSGMFRDKSAFDLVKTKIRFPYCYIDGFDKFEHSLPDIVGFFDQLHDDEISDEEYQRCVDIWEHFGCNTMTDYFRVYLKSSTCLLEDFFENFRCLFLDKYHLDVAHYYTIASFSWDSMMKYNGVEAELLQDKDMIDFIKNNIRGGVSQCSKRHAKANNKYCDYDKTKPPSFIVYLDANNLGGWAMSQNLPFSDFTWLKMSEIQLIADKITNLDENNEYGYIFEVDLEYPKELHEPHNDFPFCCQRLFVPPPPTSPDRTKENSVLSFYKKQKYVIDYRMLKQCLQNRLVLTKIHRVLRFRQCKWLEPYMTYNTTLRAAAENDFEKQLYKLLNNSVYGKTIQKSSTDKPIHAGFSIVELSKAFLYDFHYNHMLPRYKNNIDLLYTDTDSLVYEIRTFDFYEDLKSDPGLLSLMDTSNLPSRWNIPSKNKKVAGKMKDEYDGKIIREFFGVGSKVYFLDVEGKEVKKAGGMKDYVKAKYIHREDYEKCVLYDKKISRGVWDTSTEKHVVQTKKTRKVMLSPGDRKRCVLPDKVNTRAWGYDCSQTINARAVITL